MEAFHNELNDFKIYLETNLKDPNTLPEQSLKTIESRVNKIVETLKKQHQFSPIDDQLERQLYSLIHKISTSPLKSSTTCQKAIGIFKATLKNKVYTESFSIRSLSPSRIEKLIFGFKSLYRSIANAITKSVRQTVYLGWAQKMHYPKKVAALQKLEETPIKSQAHGELIEAKKQELKDWINKYEERQKKAGEIREAFGKLGGERVEVTTADNVRLDALYLSGNEFRSKLREAGAQSIQFDIPLENGETFITKGLVFSEADFVRDKGDVLKTFKRLYGFTTFDQNGAAQFGAGWSLVNWNNQILILPSQDMSTLLKGEIVSFDDGKLEAADNSAKVSQANVFYNMMGLGGVITPLAEVAESAGTVILGEGSGEVYEMSRTEPLAFLLQGCNVMLFNPRGYGESQGEPSTEGTYQDVEAIYQYLSREKQIPDEKMIAKGYCLSSGMMAELAVKHPGVNAIFDRSYSELSHQAIEIASETVQTMLGVNDKASSSIIRRGVSRCIIKILSPIVKALTPSYDLKKRIPHIKGQILLIRGAYDDMWSSKETEELLRVVPQEENPTRIRVGTLAGDHGTLWADTYQKREALSAKEWLENPPADDTVLMDSKYFADEESDLNEDYFAADAPPRIEVEDPEVVDVSFFDRQVGEPEEWQMAPSGNLLIQNFLKDLELLRPIT